VLEKVAGKEQAFIATALFTAPFVTAAGRSTPVTIMVTAGGDDPGKE
jgi:hypothetical protein